MIVTHLEAVIVVQRRRGRRRRRALLAVRPALLALVRAAGVPALAPLARLPLALGRRHVVALLLAAAPLAALRTPREPRYYNPTLARALGVVPRTVALTCDAVC